MGITKSTISYDFCGVVREKLLQTDVDFNDHETWKTIFTTEMSDRDIAMYVNWNSVRLMRRNKPHNLANLLYRCMQQLIAFLDKATLPGATVVHRTSPGNQHELEQQEMASKSTAAVKVDTEQHQSPQNQNNNKSVVDACAAQNALRILAQVLAVVYETRIEVDQSIRPSFHDDEDDVGPTSHPQKGHDELIDKLLKLPQSPFAVPFAECFFEQNLKCDSRAPTAGFPPLFAENALRAAQSGWDKNVAGDDKRCGMLPVPLGAELVVVLTRLFFVPGFSVELGAVPPSAMRYLRGISTENATCGHDIVLELLGPDGLFWERKGTISTATAAGGEVEPKVVEKDGATAAAAASASTTTSAVVATKLYNTVFSIDVQQNRLQLLRCLICALSKNALTGRPIIVAPKTDLLRQCFVDIARTPLSLTLVASCFSYICGYESRGAVPFSSHYFADVPEMLLSKCMEFLCIVFAFPPDCCSLDDADTSSGNSCNNSGTQDFFTPFIAAASRSRHSLWLALVKILSSEPKAAPAIVSGLCTVLNNPVYAASTTIKGSQRVIETAHEASCLLWTLCFAPGTQKMVLPILASACVDSVRDPSLFGGAYVIMGLLRIVLRGLEERRHIGNCQTALWLLFLLSGDRSGGFVAALSMPLVAGMCPLPSLENLNKAKVGSVSVGDALVLALCEICCPAAPRWLLPVTELTANILANTVPQLPRLMEITQFELFHLLEWVSGAFLAVQRSSVNQDSCLLAVVDMYVAAATQRPLDFKPLVASLATEVKVSDRLKHFVDMQPRDARSAEIAEKAAAAAAAAIASTDESAPPLKLAPTYRPGAFVRAALPLTAFCELERIAIEKMNEGSRTPVTSCSTGRGDGESADPYAALSSAIPYFPAAASEEEEDGSAIKLRSTQPSMELLRWGICQSWAMVVQANITEPLFDVTKAEMFR